jgi:hypothetical protein
LVRTVTPPPALVAGVVTAAFVAGAAVEDGVELELEPPELPQPARATVAAQPSMRLLFMVLLLVSSGSGS